MDRIMRDHKTYAFLLKAKRQEEALSKALFITAIALLSVMGWKVIETERPAPVASCIDKAELKRLTTLQLAEHTVMVNAEMERRAKGLK